MRRILTHVFENLIPYSFASTSHFILTFSISFTVVLGATILGFQRHGNKGNKAKGQPEGTNNEKNFNPCL
jgi:F0F1-type ATP synthase membrane subunit a